MKPTSWQTKNRGKLISGGETLAYCEMVARVFAALGRCPPLLSVLSIPLSAFHLAVAMQRCVPLSGSGQLPWRGG